MTRFQDTGRELSSVITLTPLETKTKIQVPASDRTFFYTGGRMLSYNVPNKNGLVFFQQDCEKVLSSLESSLANVAHIKPGNDVADPYGLSNAVCGAISRYVSDVEGIDIVVKNDRSAVTGMGFSEEDFKPLTGRFSAYSQESDFTPNECPWITVPINKVDKITPQDVVDTYDYQTGKSMGLRSSFYDAGADRWNYARDPKGNVVFVNLKPASFAGVGHVMRPADESAQIYTYAASVEGEKVIASLYPRPDPEQATAPTQGRETSQHKEPPNTMADTLQDLFPHIATELEQLREKGRTLSQDNSTVAQEREAAKVEAETARRELSEFKTAQEALVTELKSQIETLNGTITEKDAALNQHKAKALSSERLAALEAIHPFKEEEKTDEFVKSLSEVSPDRFETMLVRQELAKAKADGQQRAVSHINGGGFVMTPAPTFDGQVPDFTNMTAKDLI